jgi:hypothetical protein
MVFSAEIQSNLVDPERCCMRTTWNEECLRKAVATIGKDCDKNQWIGQSEVT